MTKPFSVSELMARVEALCRRVSRTSGKAEEKAATALVSGEFILDENRRVLLKAGRPIELTQVEFQIMELFLRAPQVVLSAERILERVWGWDSDAEINVVWAHISNLRKKLKNLGSRVSIYANRGMGYVLEVRS